MITNNQPNLFKLKLKLFGYQTTGPAIAYTDQIAQIHTLLSDLPDTEQLTATTCCSKKKVTTLARNFMNKHFKLHQISSCKATDLQKAFKNGTAAPTTFISTLTDIANPINPFELPVYYEPGHSMVGQTKKNTILIDHDIITQEPIMFDRIELGESLTTLSAGTYCHEIVHTQIESNKGSNLIYSNREVLSILIEKIFAFEIDESKKTLNKSQLARFKYMAEILSALQTSPNKIYTPAMIKQYEYALYIPGTLQAVRLFDIYVDGNDQVRNEMIANIQKVFDNNIIVEDLLAFYNVTYENSQDTELVKKHLSL